MNVLALDPGTYMGWAYGVGIDPKDIRWIDKVRFGMWDLNPRRGESAGYRYIYLIARLKETINQYGKPAVVYYEQVERHAGTSAAHVYGAIVGHIQAYCDLNSIPYKGVPVPTWKKHSIGNGNAKKELIFETMKKQFSQIEVQDQADALGILKYVIEKELA